MGIDGALKEGNGIRGTRYIRGRREEQEESEKRVNERKEKEREME